MFLQISLQKRGAAVIDSWEFSNALCREQFHHTVVLSSGNAMRDHWSESEYRRIVWVDTYGSAVHSFLWWTLSVARPLRLMCSIRSLDPRMIYATHFHPWLILIFWYARLRGFRTAYAVHEDPFQSKEAGGAFIRFLERVCFKQPDTIITHTEYIRRCITPHAYGRRTTVFPLGAYRDWCSSVRHQASSGPVRLLFFGRIEEWKGLRFLIDAVALLKEKNSMASLIVAGSGFISPDLSQKMVALGIDVRCRWIDDDETHQLLSETDVVVLPYCAASQSGVASMAIACGIPIIASRIGGLPEQIIDGYNGLLCEPGNSVDLAEKIKHFIQHPESLRQFGENATRLGKEVLSWDVTARGLIDIYNKAV